MSNIKDDKKEVKHFLMVKNMIKKLRIEKCSKSKEWDFAKRVRQQYFFDAVPINDPYTWSFEHEEHLHFVFYWGDELTGYAHIQLWPNQRAALRIIVIDEPHRNKNLGSQFLRMCEDKLRTIGIKSLHDEARPTAVNFYRKNGYTGMPFNDPSGEPPSEVDTPLGKMLHSS